MHAPLCTKEVAILELPLTSKERAREARVKHQNMTKLIIQAPVLCTNTVT